MVGSCYDGKMMVEAIVGAIICISGLVHFDIADDFASFGGRAWCVACCYVGIIIVEARLMW